MKNSYTGTTLEITVYDSVFMTDTVLSIKKVIDTHFNFAEIFFEKIVCIKEKMSFKIRPPNKVNLSFIKLADNFLSANQIKFFTI